jgi:hypothetical protein
MPTTSQTKRAHTNEHPVDLVRLDEHPAKGAKESELTVIYRLIIK